MRCANCGVELVGGMINSSRCPKCGCDFNTAREIAERRAKEQERAQEEAERLRTEFLSTTGNSFEGYSITRYIKIMSSEVVLGTGMFAEFSASVSDMFGVKSMSMGNKLTAAKGEALNRLINECIYAGANAAIGVDMEIMTLGQNMIVASAIGTAVVIEKK